MDANMPSSPHSTANHHKRQRYTFKGTPTKMHTPYKNQAIATVARSVAAVCKMADSDIASEDEAESDGDRPDLVDHSDSDSESESSEDEDEKRKRLQADASASFSETLINAYLDGEKVTAKLLCILCQYATDSGMGGLANKLKYKPGRQSGKYSGRVKKVLGFDKHDRRLYKLGLVGHDKFDLSRSTLPTWCIPPHEALHEEVADADESITDRLADAIRGSEWAQNYTEHPVVLANPTKHCIPCALYLDGAPFSKNDGFLGYFGFTT
jgi:hypothetical protein